MEERIVTKPKNARVFKSKTKVMLINFFDVHGIVTFIGQILAGVVRHEKAKTQHKQ